MSLLFEPLTLRGTTLRNRAWVSPMCQYSATDGVPEEWHHIHLGSRAVGGAGLVTVEATAVVPEGRISPEDLGLWNDTQTQAFAGINRFMHEHGTTTGIQLGHAGRKASTFAPWRGRGSVPLDDGGWQTVAPSPVAFGRYEQPKELTLEEISAVIESFTAAAVRADQAGFDVVEIHAAHGYLLHQFLSPLSNKRVDGYGGDHAGRSRLLIETVDAVRAVWPDRKPLFVRLSATDWAEGGWSVEDTVEVARGLAGHGVDLIDVSSGGLTPAQKITVGAGYQVPFARAVRDGSGLPVSAVGLITEPEQAEAILADGSADAIMLARELLRDPYWPLRAAHQLGAEVEWPQQYSRGVWER